MSLDGVLLGSDVDRLNGGFTSSVDGVVPGDESDTADPSAFLSLNGTGLGVFILRSSIGLIGLCLIVSDERTWTDTGRWPILPATVNRAASGS